MARNINYNVEVDAFVFRNIHLYYMNRDQINYFSGNEYFYRKQNNSAGSCVGLVITAVIGVFFVLMAVIMGG